MKSISVSIAEGKKGFSRLIQDAVDKGDEVVVTKRGKPVAVIVPYDAYRHTRRMDGLAKIMETRRAFEASGVKAATVYRESRKQLEKRP